MMTIGEVLHLNRLLAAIISNKLGVLKLETDSKATSTIYHLFSIWSFNFYSVLQSSSGFLSGFLGNPDPTVLQVVSVYCWVPCTAHVQFLALHRAEKCIEQLPWAGARVQQAVLHLDPGFKTWSTMSSKITGVNWACLCGELASLSDLHWSPGSLGCCDSQDHPSCGQRQLKGQRQAVCLDKSTWLSPWLRFQPTVVDNELLRHVL